jgi:hypothetical protein
MLAKASWRIGLRTWICFCEVKRVLNYMSNFASCVSINTLSEKYGNDYKWFYRKNYLKTEKSGSATKSNIG